MRLPFLIRLPYEIFIRENVTFIIWFILVLLGSLSGLIALSGNKEPHTEYLLAGGYFITVISLSSVYISDIVVYLLDKHRLDEKMDSSLPIQILILIFCIIFIFISAIEFKSVISMTDELVKQNYIKNSYQWLIYLFSLILGIYSYSINRMSKYPDLLKYLKSTDKAKTLELTDEGESL